MTHDEARYYDSGNTPRGVRYAIITKNDEHFRLVFRVSCERGKKAHELEFANIDDCYKYIAQF